MEERVQDVVRWDATLERGRQKTLEEHATTLEAASTSAKPPLKFSCSHEINHKVAMFHGKAHALRADAIAHAASEKLDFNEPESASLLEAAGEKLFNACAELGSIRPSDATATDAFNLPASRVIHAVGPTYHGDDPNLARAAESSLSRAYRSTLELLLQEDLRSLALPCLYTRSKGYPREAASHVALRTIRRFLEDWLHRIDVIVLCVEGDDREVYWRNMPLYFPRSDAEERVAREALPSHPGDDLGQAYDALDNVSIKPTPLPVANGQTYSSLKHKPGGSLEPSWWGSSERIGMHIGPEDPESEAEQYHVRLLKRARQYDLSDVEDLNVLYLAGHDAASRPVIALVATQLEKALKSNIETRLLMYASREFGPVCRQRFTGLFVASGCNNVPSRSFARRLCAALGPRHKENLKVLYVLHPSFRLRTAFAATSILRCGVPKRVMKKVTFIDSLDYLQRCGCVDVELPSAAYQVERGDKVQASSASKNGADR